MILHRMKLVTLAAALGAFWMHGAAAAPVIGASAIHKAEASHGNAVVEVRYYYHGTYYRYRYNHRYYHHRRYRHGHWHYY